MTTVDDLAESERHIRASAAVLGPALASVPAYTAPGIARAVAAEQNLYDRIETEFGLLTAGEAGRLLGSRSTAPRNLATATRKDGRLLAVRRGHQMLYPGFQFGTDGQPLPVIADLITLAGEHSWTETSVIQWLCGPTTYLEGERPVDHLPSSPERVLATAGVAWEVEW